MEPKYTLYGINNMKEIDQKLKQWIYNSIIRAEVRKLIVKELEKAQMYGYEAAHDEVRAD